MAPIEILVGIVAEADYPRFLPVIVDPADFPPVYADYKARVQNSLERAKKQTANVREMPVAPKELSAWCAAQEIAVDPTARNSFNLFKHLRQK